MAVRTSCARCGKRFSAPEDYLGRKVDCPRCGHRSVLRSPEEEKAIQEEEAAERRRREEDQRRIALLERLERKNERLQPYYERFQTGVEAVRHYHPNAPSRYLRLRALSDLLILMAYLCLVLMLAGASLTVYLKVEGTIESIPLLLLCLIAWTMAGGTLYFGLKYLGEVAFFLADAGDQQNDLVQLLRDLRDTTDRLLIEGPDPGSGET